MSLAPLATPAQLSARMTSVTATPEALDAALTDASAAVRAFTGQVFNHVISTDGLKVACCGVLRLPQRPVLDVQTVTTATVYGADDVGFAWDGGDRLEVDSPAVRFVVTYEHGYDDGMMPDDVVAIVCNVAARTLGHPREDAGVTQQSITNFSESFGAVGAAGPAGLFDDEKAVLARYRRVGAQARVCIR